MSIYLYLTNQLTYNSGYLHIAEHLRNDLAQILKLPQSIKDHNPIRFRIPFKAPKSSNTLFYHTFRLRVYVHRIHDHVDRVRIHYLLVGGIHRDVPQRRAAAVADVGVLQVGYEDVRHDVDPVVLPSNLLIPALPRDVPKSAEAVETHAGVLDVRAQYPENHLDSSDIPGKYLVVSCRFKKKRNW